MYTPEQIKAMLDMLRDQGFICADDDDDMQAVYDLALSVLDN